jgi:hypothetical protein
VSQRVAIVLAVVTALLGAGIGVGATLYFAERGPAGPQGEQGNRGPRGYEGEVFDPDVLQSQLDDLDGRISDLESTLGPDYLVGPRGLADDFNGLESDYEQFKAVVCRTLDLICY